MCSRATNRMVFDSERPDPKNWRGSRDFSIDGHKRKRHRTPKPGMISYQCKHNKHRSQCAKLDCPCWCHKAE